MTKINHHHRGFSSKFGFLMAAVGSAVGLGNIWAFPFKVGNNGGAVFIFVYILMSLLVGVIAMVGELAIGKRSQSNVLATFSGITKASKWVGYLGIIIPVFILFYYPVIGGWSLKFAFDYTFGTGVGGLPAGSDYKAAFTDFTGSPMAVVFLALFIIIVCIIVLFGVKKGIENASKILMPLLFFCMLAVIIYGLTLDGMEGGLKYLFVPNFEGIENWGTVILTALGQVFFSMSLGMGINIAYGSYMGKNMKIGQSAMIVGVMDTFMALLAGLAIFPAVFAYGMEPAQGPSLLFVVLAEVFGKMGVMGRVFGAIFFLLVVIAAVTSCIALLEVPVQFLVEKYKVNRKLASVCVAAIVLGVGAFVSLSFGDSSLQVTGVDLLTILDTVVNTMFLPICALVTCLLVGWWVKPKNLRELFDTRKPISKFGFDVWSVLVRTVTPVGIGAIMVVGIIDLFNGKTDIKLYAGQLTIVISAAVVFALAILVNIGSFIYDKYSPLIAEKYRAKKAKKLAAKENKI